MTHLDPDNDLLERMDRKERLADIVTAAKALAGGFFVAFAVYEVARALAWNLAIAGDAAIVIFIGVTIWLFRKLDKALSS